MTSLLNPLRKKIVVNRKLQYLITGFFVGLTVVSTIFSIAMLNLFTQGILIEVNELSEGPKAALTKAILENAKIYLFWQIGFATFLIVFATLAGVVLLHRIAGPAVALKNYLIDVRQGQKPKRHPLKFRNGDFLQDVADDLAPLVDDYLALREKQQK